VYKISAQSDVVVKSYRVNGRPDALTDSRVYSLFEYTKRNIVLVFSQELLEKSAYNF
jgi:hypothetical protein